MQTQQAQVLPTLRNFSSSRSQGTLRAQMDKLEPALHKVLLLVSVVTIWPAPTLCQTPLQTAPHSPKLRVCVQWDRSC